MTTQEQWARTLADVAAGRRPDFTRKTSGAIPTYEQWMNPARTGYYDARNAALVTRGTGGEDGTQGQNVGLRAADVTRFQNMANQAGVNYSNDNPSQYDYLSTYYNLPSYRDNSIFSYGPMLAAAVLGGAAFAGAGAGGAAAGGTAAADAAGLAAMGTEAGLSGAALDGFVASGGTLGSTAAGGGGIGLASSIPVGGAVEGTAPILSAGAPTATALPAAAGTAAGTGSLIPGIPNNVLAGVGQGFLGYLGADKVSDAYKNVSNQNLALGAPYRSRLDASYQPGFDLMSQPGYGDAFNRAAEISARQWSTRGNPAGNPTLQAGILNDVWSQNYLPALSNYRGQLGQFSGLGLNTAGLAQLGGAQNAGGTYDAIGYGLGTALNPQPSIMDILRQYQQPNYNLVIGGLPTGGR